VVDFLGARGGLGGAATRVLGCDDGIVFSGLSFLVVFE
jgi:hypothetical protein